jgi:catechol 2,3-dioxygenase-like lactoylglutathione lyase family enzyme
MTSSGPSGPDSVSAGTEPKAAGLDPDAAGTEPDPLATPAEPLVPQQSTGPRHAAPDGEPAPVTAAADAPAARGHGAGDGHHDSTEDTMFGAATSPLRSSPLQVKRAGKLPPTIPAPRADDEPYDHAYDESAVAEGYRHALPPPGADPDQHTAAPDVTVQLFVSNLSRAVIFYRDILGFTEIDAGRKSAVLHLGDIRVVLKVVDDLLPSSKNVQFSLEVDDLEMAYEDLRARGVRFVHRPRRVEHYEQLEHFAAPFEDPDGHRISLSSWRAIYRTDD